VPAAEIQLHLANDSFAVEGQRVGIVLLAGFLLSFGFIRMSTRLMRSPKVPWWPGSVTPGGLHIHHLVFGIVLMMIVGLLAFTLQPESPWIEILAGLFGVGAGLTIDEFALWLHLEDVYWSEEGRRSVDAMIVATIVAGGFVLGLAPFGSDSGDSSVVVLGVSILLHLAVCLIAGLKGKAWSVLAGMFFPPIAYVAAIRLARPGSWWARRYYSEDSEKLTEAASRVERQERRYRRIQDLIGGRPSTAGN